MNTPTSITVAEQAIDKGRKALALFSGSVARKIALAHVAEWVGLQDESIAAYRVMTIAQHAITAINAHPWEKATV